ncbi:MAG: transcriptional regulator [Elusimicrobiota bacterium]|jgi:probable addiction module antidote protein
MKRARSYEKELQESLKDPVQAAGYLRAAYQDADKRVFLLALKDVIDAHSGMSHISRTVKLDRRHLYVMLSKNGNPEWFSVTKLLTALGIDLTFQPRKNSSFKTAA